MDLWGTLASLANLTADVFAVAAIIGASIILLTALSNRAGRGRARGADDRRLRWVYLAFAFGALIVAGILMTEGFTTRAVGLIFPMSFRWIVLLLVAAAVMVAVARWLDQRRRARSAARRSPRSTRRRRASPPAKSRKARPRAK